MNPNQRYVEGLSKLDNLSRSTRPMLYCVVVLSVFVTWVLGSAGLGPLDDHAFIRTIFQGKDFGAYVFPELGRFFPLTAQEYVVASKLVGPSAQIFYVINALKLVLCGGALYYCLILAGLNGFSAAALWSLGMFSMGIANTLFRLSAGELNQYILLLIYVLCFIQCQQSPAIENRKIFKPATVAFVAYFLALFYKEITFVFGLIFSLSEIVRSYLSTRKKPSRLIVSTLLASIFYIVLYGIWRATYVTGSYATFHAISILDVLEQFAWNDPFVFFVAIPLTAYRFVMIITRRRQYTFYDSLMLAASAYVCAYLVMGIYNTYYLLPTYAFFICGVAGITVIFHKKMGNFAIISVAVLISINTFPMALSDIQAQKLIANNHARFVDFLSDWILENPETSPQPRNVVLAGVSPGSGVEILHSLKTFLVASGVPTTSFEIKATAPIDNELIAEFYGLQAMQAYKPNIGDLLIFNPYQQVPVRPPLQAPSYKEIYRSDSSWAPPRWLAWQWIKFCMMHRSECEARVDANLRYVGYAAVLVTRASVPVSDAQPIKNPSYRIDTFKMPTRISAGAAMRLNVLIHNTGAEIWPADGTLRLDRFVNLSYRWFDLNGRVVLEGDRVPFPEAIRPGDMARFSIVIKVPTSPGKYKLAIGPVQEGVRWFAVDSNLEINIF